MSILVLEVIATALFVVLFLALTDRMGRARNRALLLGLGFGGLLLVAAPFSSG